jgi:SNF2 family DNA or RNA helicase
MTETLDWNSQKVPTVWVGLTDARTYYRIKFDYHPALVEKMAVFFPRHWSKPKKEWMVAASAETLEKIKKQFPDAVMDTTVTDQSAKMASQEAAVDAVKMTLQMGAEVPLPADVHFHTEPHAHQRKALAFCLARPQFGIFAEPGTGKTKITLDLVAYLKRVAEKAGQVFEPSLVFCPASLLENWKKEAEKHQPGLRVFPLIKGNSPEKEAQVHALRQTNAADIIVVNYETVWRIDGVFKAYYWSALVLDEAHRIKNRTSKQAKATVKIGAWARRRYLLTGTPMPNSPLELFNQIKFLDPLILGTSYYGFRDRYAVMGGYQGYQVVGWKNLDELANRISKISYSVKKKDCLDLPDKVYKEYRLPMSEMQGKTYRQMAETLVAEVDGKTITVDVILAKLTKLRQITAGFLYADDASLRFKVNPKLIKLLEILEDIITDHKVVIWTVFDEEVKMIEEMLKAWNADRRAHGQSFVETATLDGSVPIKDRAGIVENFQSSGDVRVFIANQKAGGEGITLTAADYCVFFSNEYSTGVRGQAEDRLHRIGQKANVVYIDLLMKGSIDVAIKSALARKRKLAEIVETGGLKEMVYGGGIPDEGFESDGGGSGEEIRGGEAQH